MARSSAIGGSRGKGFCLLRKLVIEYERRLGGISFGGSHLPQLTKNEILCLFSRVRVCPLVPKLGLSETDSA